VRGVVSFSAALLATVLGLPSAAAEPAPGAHTHDGFYLRLALGGGALHATFTGGSSPGDSKGGGGAAMLDVLIGGTPASGLVVGGGYQFDMAQHADFNFGPNDTGSDGNVIRGVVGPFVEWFPDPHGGFSAGLLGGYTVLALQTPSIRIFGTELGGNIDTLGIGGNLWASYALWISSQWSLGLEARGGLAATRSRDDSAMTGSATSWGVLLTGVYH
jgi:hypothetical protein